MILEEIAKKECESNYMKLRVTSKEETDTAYSSERYWEMNKEYFFRRAKIYLEVMECLKEGNGSSKS